MKFLAILALLVFVSSFSTLGQEKHASFSGKIFDEKGNPLVGAAVALKETGVGVFTDNSGFFEIKNIKPGTYHLHISYIGYKCVHFNEITFTDSNIYREFLMTPDNIGLSEVVISANSTEARKRETSTAIEVVDKKFIEQNLNSSFMKSIEKLPGVSSMEVGQGFSKPMIRGLGFNRVVVTENGIKQEGQQWGADHGLEIDQFGVEDVEVIKGPSSLIYGSDAIGGVVKIQPRSITAPKSLSGNFGALAKSINNTLGSSLSLKGRGNLFHFNLQITALDFGDYKTPADSFYYNSYHFPIHDGILKNTAGKEKDIYFSVGFIKTHFTSLITFSNVNSKIGFFPGSHGIPTSASLADDTNHRDIDLPYQSVNHLKILSNSKIILTKGIIELDLGYQNNHRQEWSRFHTHYVGQQAPEINPDLELQFALQTLSTNLKYKISDGKQNLVMGVNGQFQENQIGGYMFLLPEYQKDGIGIFAYYDRKIGKKNLVNFGLRYDWGLIRVAEYFSEYTGMFKSRDLTKTFDDFTFALGINHNINQNYSLKANIGKSFRMPTASELSANGVHHGSFRYEVGDTAINSEVSYQADLGFLFSKRNFRVEISPFINYFPNFVYLNPTGSYLHPDGYEIQEADAGQVYQYVQSEAFRAGGEVFARIELKPKIVIEAVAEYVYATDFKYPIPFTPPFNLNIDVSKAIDFKTNILSDFNLSASYLFSAAQNRNARNEPPTPAYNLFGAAINSKVALGHFKFNFAIQVQNIFDTKYFNHLSFYRLIDLPEAGRNFQILIKIPFGK